MGCWTLIRLQVAKAESSHERLRPWLYAFDVEVIAAMNRVLFSQLAELCEEHERIANVSLEDLSEQIFDYWRASDAV